ncbi:hypothetical protein [Streptomyces sp. NPDC015345]|uniref:hypothetical protein n=1 Tax=Streptomyces sp. NPDC015345 TaxID=3364953 RepID=UPI0036FD7007
MAVTQQLARIPAEYLASCRQAAEASKDGDPLWDPPSADVLDLDWAPFLLERVCELGGLNDVHRSALRQALDGDTAIDLAFLNTHPHAIGPFGQPPLPSLQVKWLALRNCSGRSTFRPSWPPCRQTKQRPPP